MKRAISILLMILCLVCCNRSVKDIEIQGVVIDKISGKTIDGAKLMVLCWRWSKIEMNDEEYSKRELHTDKNGKFSMNFEMGHRLDIAAFAKGYEISRFSQKLTKGTLDLTIEMEKVFGISPNVNVDEDSIRIFNNLFVGFRNYYQKEKRFTEFWGIDFSKGISSNIESEADIWLKDDGMVDSEHFTLTSPPGGGLIPIYQSDITHSFKYEKKVAPDSGYLEKYKLNGREAGFFVKSKKNGNYGKLILLKNTTKGSVPVETGYYDEFNLNFELILQLDGTNNLNFISTGHDMDLEQYLLDTL